MMCGCVDGDTSRRKKLEAESAYTYIGYVHGESGKYRENQSLVQEAAHPQRFSHPLSIYRTQRRCGRCFSISYGRMQIHGRGHTLVTTWCRSTGSIHKDATCDIAVTSASDLYGRGHDLLGCRRAMHDSSRTQNVMWTQDMSSAEPLAAARPKGCMIMVLEYADDE